MPIKDNSSVPKVLAFFQACTDQSIIISSDFADSQKVTEVMTRLSWEIDLNIVELINSNLISYLASYFEKIFVIPIETEEVHFWEFDEIPEKFFIEDTLIPEVINEMVKTNKYFFNSTSKHDLGIVPELLYVPPKQLSWMHACVVSEEAHFLAELSKHLNTDKISINFDNRHIFGLDLHGCSLKSLPEAIEVCKYLEWLHLQENELSTLPNAVETLTNLNILWLNKNQFTTFPSVLCQLQHLRELDLTKNHLSFLPDTIGQLETLEKLFLDNNHLLSLPDSIMNLTKLRILWLRGNEDLALPDCIFHLPSLSKLKLDSGKFDLSAIVNQVPHAKYVESLLRDDKLVGVKSLYFTVDTPLPVSQFLADHSLTVFHDIWRLTYDSDDQESFQLFAEGITERINAGVFDFRHPLSDHVSFDRPTVNLASYYPSTLVAPQDTLLPDEHFIVLYLTSNQLTHCENINQVKVLNKEESLQSLISRIDDEFLTYRGDLELLFEGFCERFNIDKHRARIILDILVKSHNYTIHGYDPDPLPEPDMEIYVVTPPLTLLGDEADKVYSDISISLTPGGATTLLRRKMAPIERAVLIELEQQFGAIFYEPLWRLKSSGQSAFDLDTDFHILALHIYSKGFYSEKHYVLPESIGQLVHLEYLDLSGNQLTCLPQSIGQLVHLQELNLGDNQLTSLPETIGLLTNLLDFSLYENRLTALPKSFGQLINLKLLFLHKNQLTALPDNFIQLINLQRLILEDNQLTSLPKGFSKLISLKRLHLDRNLLTSLPKNINELTNLVFLLLQNNKLTSLPDSISQLSCLDTLDLSFNLLTALPENFGDLTNLTSLSFDNNRLKTLPVSITLLTHLKHLYLDGNPIHTLPETVKKWLEYLNDHQCVIHGLGYK